MGKKIKKRVLSIISSLLIAVFMLSAGLPRTSIDVSAARKIKMNFPTNDLARVKDFKVIELEPTIIGKRRVKVRGSKYHVSNNVDKGEHYYSLTTDYERAIYTALIQASEYVYPSGEWPESDSDAGCIQFASEMDTKLNTKDPTFFTAFNNALEAAKYDHIDNLQLTLCHEGFLVGTEMNPATGKEIYNACIYLSCDPYNDFSQETFNAMTLELRRARTAILSDRDITGAVGVIGRELAIHDKLLEINTYDNDCYNLPAERAPYDLGHTAYGALINHKSVCDGYAMAYTYLLEGISVESRVIGGQANNGGHAWNIVNQDGEWYEVDATWDDQELDNTFSKEEKDTVYHLFYHLTTDDISNHAGYNHNIKIDPSQRYRDGFSNNSPIARGTKYNYEGVLAYINRGGRSENVPVTGIFWNLAQMSINKGERGTFYAYVLPIDADNQTISWSSDNEDVLIVDENGRYEAVGEGTCIVTAEAADGGHKLTCEVRVLYENETPGGEGNNDQNETPSGDGNNDQNENPSGDGTADDENSQSTPTTDPTHTPEPTPTPDPIPTPDPGQEPTAITSGENEFTVDTTGEATVTKEDNKSIKSVKIEDTVEENGNTYKIVKIAGNAYKNCKKLTSVSLGENIEEIGSGAFSGCTKLKKIAIHGNNLKKVGSGSFKNIKKGAKITIICKNKKVYNRLVKKIKKAGAKKAVFKFKKG